MRKIVNACDLWWLVWWVWGPDMKQNQVVKVITCVYSSLCSGTWLLNRRRMTSRKFISLKTGAKLYYTINVVGGRDFSVTAQAELGHGVGTVGHLSDIFLVICENTNWAFESEQSSIPRYHCLLSSNLRFVCLFFFPRNLVSDKQDSLAQCADFRNSLPSQEAMLCSGPLAVIQGRTSKYALTCFIWSACFSLFSYYLFM